MNGTPELSEGFTQIPNELLTSLAKAQMQGNITSRERAVIDFIIRNTYGYHKDYNNLKTSFIAKELGTTACKVSQLLKRLQNKNIIIKDGDEIFFNKHYNEWKEIKLPNHFLKTPETSEKINQPGKVFQPIETFQPVEISTNCNKTFQPIETTISTSCNIEPEQKQIETERNDPLNKTNKYNINKTNIINNISEKIADTLTKENQKIIKKHNEEQRREALSLIYWFSKNILEIDTPAPGFINREIRHAYRLLTIMPSEEIKSVCLWRKQTADDFWRKKFVSLGNLWTHLTDWASEAKIKQLTFAEYLDQNPSLDYRKIEDDYAKVKAFFLAFSRALKEGAIPTTEEWKKYQTAREINKKQGSRQWA